LGKANLARGRLLPASCIAITSTAYSCRYFITSIEGVGWATSCMEGKIESAARKFPAVLKVISLRVCVDWVGI
jgi:hypothetical protein